MEQEKTRTTQYQVSVEFHSRQLNASYWSYQRDTFEGFSDFADYLSITERHTLASLKHDPRYCQMTSALIRVKINGVLVHSIILTRTIDNAVEVLAADV